MYELPIELHCKIFENLTFNQLLNCKQVCKKWRDIFYFMRIKSLTICKRSKLSETGIHFMSNNSINQNILLHVTNLKFLKSNFNENILSRLKVLYLNIDSLIPKNSFNSIINDFHQLEQLELDNYTQTRLEIKLDKLKILCVRDRPVETTKYILILKTPSLYAFKCSGSFHKFYFYFPERIKHLHLIEKMTEQINQFVNLEVLYLDYIKKIDYLSFERLVKLKEFHFPSIQYQRLETIQEFFNYKKKRNLKFYFYGISVHDLNEFMEIEHQLNFASVQRRPLSMSDQSTPQYYLIRNYSTLSNFIPWFMNLNFNLLVQLFDDQIPIDFWTKFCNIKIVKIDQMVPNVDQLNRFLSNCKRLNALFITNSSLSQSFFNFLPNCCPFLTLLDINEPPNTLKSLRFVLKFDFLERLMITEKPSAYFVSKLLSRDQMKYFSFFMSSKENIVIKNGTERTFCTHAFTRLVNPMWLAYYESCYICSSSKTIEIISQNNRASFKKIEDLIEFIKIVLINSN